MLTIGKLAKNYGLSRSTLLYYDRIGLLAPSGRTPANYRIYTDRDARRLEKICLYRRAGLDLATIGDILEAGHGSPAEALEQQLSDLNHEISRLRRQQRLIVSLLKELSDDSPVRILDKAGWVDLLRTAGMDDSDMVAWHQAFEQTSPEAHHHFLVWLGLSTDEIEALRRRSRIKTTSPQSNDSRL